MKLYKKIILTLSVVLGLGILFAPSAAMAINVWTGAGNCDGVDSALCNDIEDKDKLPDMIRTIVNVLLYILGAVSVVVIIMAGIFYTVSSGDSAQVTKAKNTLLYAIVGLVVALMSYAIVNFVIDKIT